MGSMLFSAPIIASLVPDCHQILRKSCQESVRKGLKGSRGGRSKDVGLAVEGRDQTIDAVLLQDGRELGAAVATSLIALSR